MKPEQQHEIQIIQNKGVFFQTLETKIVNLQALNWTTIHISFQITILTHINTDNTEENVIHSLRKDELNVVLED